MYQTDIIKIAVNALLYTDIQYLQRFRKYCVFKEKNHPNELTAKTNCIFHHISTFTVWPYHLHFLKIF